MQSKVGGDISRVFDNFLGDRKQMRLNRQITQKRGKQYLRCGRMLQWRESQFLGRRAIFLGALEDVQSSELTERESRGGKQAGNQVDYLHDDLWSS